MLHHRILLIAFPAQGHINPALQFAKRLIRLGADVTLATTLHMHRRISNNPTTIPGLSFLPFSDGYDDGFTGSYYSLYVSEFNRRGTEFVTTLILSSSQEGRPFTCLVYTLFLPWAAEVARGLHLPTAMLWVQPSAMLAIHYHYFHDYGSYIEDKVTKEPSACSIDLPGLPSLVPNRDLPSFLLDSSSNLSSIAISMAREQFRVLDLEVKPRVLVNTFEALEAEALRSADKFNVIPIGPLISSEGEDPDEICQDESGCVEWLDSKEEKSVVYVSFGSFCVLPKNQMEELARALLDCGRPFLWVIREDKKQQQDTDEENEKLLLQEEEELELKGKIVKWCPQVEVLSHASLGCFVTHCGWNSSMESLVCGVPVVAFPRWLDQKTNAKLMEDVWKVGVRVDHLVNEDGVVEAGEIRRCLDVVMGSGERGEELRRNANKWKGLAREAVKEGGSSDKSLRTFLDDIGQ